MKELRADLSSHLVQFFPHEVSMKELRAVAICRVTLLASPCEVSMKELRACS